MILQAPIQLLFPCVSLPLQQISKVGEFGEYEGREGEMSEKGEGKARGRPWRKERQMWV